MPTIYSAGVLAGAYRGEDFASRMRIHAVSNEEIVSGKFRREGGESFCNKNQNTSTNLVDEGGWGDFDKINCPICIEKLERLRKKGIEMYPAEEPPD